MYTPEGYALSLDLLGRYAAGVSEHCQKVRWALVGCFTVPRLAVPGQGTDESSDGVAGPKVAPEAPHAIAACVPGAKVAGPQIMQKASGATMPGVQVVGPQVAQKAPSAIAPCVSGATVAGPQVAQKASGALASSMPGAQVPQYVCQTLTYQVANHAPIAQAASVADVAGFPASLRPLGPPDGRAPDTEEACPEEDDDVFSSDEAHAPAGIWEFEPPDVGRDDDVPSAADVREETAMHESWREKLAAEVAENRLARSEMVELRFVVPLPNKKEANGFGWGGFDFDAVASSWISMCASSL